MPSLPRRSFLIFIALLALLGIVAAGVQVAQEPFTVYVDGEATVVNGIFDQVGDVLAAADITVRPQDRVSPALDTSPQSDTPIEVQRAHAVTVRTDAGSDVFWTHQVTMDAILAEAGFSLARTDQIFADGNAVAWTQLDITPVPDVLEIGAFKTVTVYDGDQQHTLRTAQQTVGEALQEAGITLYAADGVDPAPGTWLTPGLDIVVRRSMPLTIHADGRVIQTRSHFTNPLDVLADAGIGLIGMDYTRPAAGSTLHSGDVIQVVRVTEDFRVEDTAIPFETRFQGSDQLEIDNRALLQGGIPGILRQRIRTRYENGTPVAEIPDGQWVAQEPVDEIIGYGTNVVVRALETPEGYFEYWRKVRMRVTSYTAASAGRPPDHPLYGVTASGLQAGTGIVAVDPRVVPFRSWVYVPGYGTGYAGDTGGGVKGRWIDLGYNENDYRSWSGYVDVYYLTPVPEPDDINYLIPTWLP
jgi:uncharacterized protein YabE (DUF348 family)/3D (Asp-Asp-Asp) domain-containing protein